jgi:hypothetical protein
VYCTRELEFSGFSSGNWSENVINKSTNIPSSYFTSQ